ncbi:MAG: hybrid sensor histidine kinase/response regulator [Anaerolineae bacterium]
MSNANTHFTLEDELYLSPQVVAAGLAAFGLVLTLLNESRPLTWPGLGTAALCYLLATGVWLLGQWRQRASRWLLCGGIAIIVVGLIWLGGPVYLVLITLPVALAAALLNLRGATVVALEETVLLWWLGWPGDSLTLPFALLAIWATWGVMLAIYQPRRRMAAWFWEHFQQAQQALEEARQRKAELAQALADLALANRQLTLLNERLAAMHLLAEEAQKAKTTFVAKVSHELRTPLNMIIGLIDVLIETPEVYDQSLPPILLEDLEIVKRNCEHLASMINDVLDLSQTEAGRLILHREWVDLADEVDNALAVVRPLLDKKQLALQVTISADTPKVYCDRTRIRQVILNLLSNAARYTDAGQITVTVKPGERYVAVSVADTGPGIAPDAAERIFDPFYQAETDLWRAQGGSGLGLSISKQFIELHQGQIWLDSRPGLGSVFAFKLPISPPTALSAGPQRWLDENWVWRERVAWPHLPETSYRQRLIICDESNTLYPLLAPYADEVELICAQDLAQASRELQGYPAHAVIINAASARQLWPLLEQARLKIPDTPLLGCALPPRLDQARAAGAVNYLVKPVIRAKLQAALEALQQPVERILVVDDTPDVQHLLRRMLGAFDDTLEVVAVSSGRQALEEMRRSQPDLVLLDIVLPDMSGWQVLEQKSQDEAIKPIPVIVISAQDPLAQPISSEALVLTMGPGVSVNQLVRCALELSPLLLRAEVEPVPTPE